VPVPRSPIDQKGTPGRGESNDLDLIRHVAGNAARGLYLLSAPPTGSTPAATTARPQLPPGRPEQIGHRHLSPSSGEHSGAIHASGSQPIRSRSRCAASR
jgi:hypothetical protein